MAYTHSPWNCKIRVLIIDNTVRESRLCILLKDNRPAPGVIVDRNLVYVQNFTPGRTYVLFLDSNGNPAKGEDLRGVPGNINPGKIPLYTQRERNDQSAYLRSLRCRQCQRNSLSCWPVLPPPLHNEFHD